MLELVQLGAEFTRDAAGALSLTREGGHSHRRIVHAADVTGREIERTLLAALSANSNIQIFEHFSAVDLITSEVRSPRAHSLCFTFPVYRSNHHAVTSSAFLSMLTPSCVALDCLLHVLSAEAECIVMCCMF